VGGEDRFSLRDASAFRCRIPPLLEPPYSYAAIAACKSRSLGRELDPNSSSWDEEINFLKAVNGQNRGVRDELFRFAHHHTLHMHSAGWETDLYLPVFNQEFIPLQYLCNRTRPSLRKQVD